MDEPTEAPSLPPRSLRDELADVDIEDSDQLEGAAPAEGTEGAPPPAVPEAPADDGDSAAPAEQLEGDAPEPAAPVAWQPPAGGQPFAFRVDGREVEVPGALRWDHGIYVPTESWGRVVQGHLADREAYTAQRGQLLQQLAAADPAVNPTVLQANATLQAFKELLDKGPLEVAKWLDNYQQNRPLLEAQIQNAALQAQLAYRTQGYQQQQEEQLATQLAQQLPTYLQQNIDAVIAQDPELAGLKGIANQALLERLWPYAEWLFFEADRDYPEYNLRRGQIIVRPDRLKQLLGQQAATAAELKRLEKAAAHNRGATGRVPAAPTVTTRGRPTPAGRAPSKPRTVQEWRDEYLSGADEES